MEPGGFDPLPPGLPPNAEDNMNTTLTQDELGLIACAIRYGRFEPQPQYLADAHRLYERGWLARASTEDGIVFSLSQQGVTALELGIPVDDAKGALN
jgi:hypothetical protein